MDVMFDPKAAVLLRKWSPKRQGLLQVHVHPRYPTGAQRYSLRTYLLTADRLLFIWNTPFADSIERAFDELEVALAAEVDRLSHTESVQ